MKKEDLTEEFIINGWLKKYHGITVNEMIKLNPEISQTIDWYKKYPVTRQQYDEWYKWAIDIISKTIRMPKKYVRRNFWVNWLNVAPNIIEE
jgi:aminoglycoside/choline kinase family phosphotransferase